MGSTSILAAEVRVLILSACLERGWACELEISLERVARDGTNGDFKTVIGEDEGSVSGSEFGGSHLLVRKVSQ